MRVHIAGVVQKRGMGFSYSPCLVKRGIAVGETMGTSKTWDAMVGLFLLMLKGRTVLLVSGEQVLKRTTAK